VHRRHYQVERGGFEGPLEVSLADRQARHLQGVSGPQITVPGNATEFDYPAFLAPWLEVGRTSRTCLMAVGTVKDADGREHRVSFSSVHQNEQIVILADPNVLSIQPERNSLMGVPGQTAELPVRVDRSQSVRLPVKVELIVPAHISGISATPMMLAADEQKGSLRIAFGEAIGQINMPLVLRATAMDRGDPIVAECKLHVAAQIR
jgi:hypothetical protein